VRLWALARRFRPDLVYANTVHAFGAVWVARALGVPAVWCIRESVDPFSPALRAGVWIRRTFRLRPHVVFVAEATRRLWRVAVGPAPSLVIPNGLPVAAIDRFAATFDARAFRAGLGLSPAARVIVIVGTTCERKGQQIFVEAALKLLRRSGDDLHFFVVGAREGEYLDRLRQTILLGGGIDRIHLVHESPEAFAYYAIADVVCCCSFEESHPRVVLEAMAFGRAIVATDVWGIPEQVTDGESALLVPPGDPMRLAARIAELLEDGGRAEALGRAARQALLARFTSDRMAARYTALAAGLLGAPHRGDA
jgi:glycosyltransferase involved in cell wall biosynthesis